MHLHHRDHEDDGVVHIFVNPYAELNAGLWLLFLSATVFLGLRIWVKLRLGHRLWYDDYILLVSWAVLFANNSLIVHEFRTGYVLRDSEQSWDDRMRIYIQISSCGTLIGQAWTKTAFGATLLRITDQRWQSWVIWFCIVTMNVWMVIKVFFQWAKVCDEKSTQQYWRLDFCVDRTFLDDFKEGGNVYNIIMDFIFATFPWLVVRRLDMRRVEKIGLAMTMSLGIIVAIIAAIRVGWKDQGNQRDEWYIYRNGVSQVWYSSEITGTILVQCIPVLRPILRDFHSSVRSKYMGSSRDEESAAMSRRRSVRAGSLTLIETKETMKSPVELKPLPELPRESKKQKVPDGTWLNDDRSSSEESQEQSRFGFFRSGSWPRQGSIHSMREPDVEHGKKPHHIV